jgi:hypothetical protein
MPILPHWSALLTGDFPVTRQRVWRIIFDCARQRPTSRPGEGDLAMAIDNDQIDDAVLALLYLGLHNEYRAWKGFDWDAMNRLHEKGMIDNPVGKAKSVVFTLDGLRRSKELFEKMFTK